MRNIQTQLVVRAIDPCELALVADLETRAFDDTLLALLGKNFVMEYYDWQRVRTTDFVLVGAWWDKELAGYSFGGVFDQGLREFYREHFWRVAGCLVRHPRKMLSPIISSRIRMVSGELFRGNGYKAAAPDAGSSSFCVGRVAVDPKFRRRGIAKRLLEELEEAAAARGLLHMHLWVGAENFAAIQLYETLGWEVRHRKPETLEMHKTLKLQVESWKEEPPTRCSSGG